MKREPNAVMTNPGWTGRRHDERGFQGIALTGLLFRGNCECGLLSGDSEEGFAPFPKRYKEPLSFRRVLSPERSPSVICLSLEPCAE
jgi:hypothetical protein